VLTLLDELHAQGRTIVMITHEEDVAEHATRRLILSEGKLHPYGTTEASA
jgi:ABC-type lipoprotein export system ATPase subunit